jgi:hypothetical protein
VPTVDADDGEGRSGFLLPQQGAEASGLGPLWQRQFKKRKRSKCKRKQRKREMNKLPTIFIQR